MQSVPFAKVLSEKDIDFRLMNDCIVDVADSEIDFVNTLNDENVLFIKSLLWRYLLYPFSELNRIQDIIESPFYSNLNSTHNHYRTAIAQFTSELLRMSNNDYFQHLLRLQREPTFNVYFNYFTLGESVNCIQRWLDYQFGNLRREFVTNLFSVVTLATNKKCSIWLHGQPNSGKTFMMESLASLFLLVGKMERLNSNNQFPFQSIPNKKIILMDEARIPKEYINDFKELLAGQSISANIKHQAATITQPVPFILLSNDKFIDPLAPE